MNELTEKLHSLSPEKRRLVELLLQMEATAPSLSLSGSPCTPEEKTLVDIWQNTLGKSPIGIHDDFFHLGGDSIQAIRVTAKSREAGIEINTRDLFNTPTIAGLLASHRKVEPSSQALDDDSSDPISFSPAQSWFFEQSFIQPDHWNEVVLIKTTPKLSFSHLQAMVQAVLEQHSSLRLGFQNSEGGVKTCFVPVSECIQLNQVKIQRNELTLQIHRLVGGLSLAKGRVVHFHQICAEDTSERWLLITAHHLVIDGVSWRVLLEDLSKAFSQLITGEAITLGLKSASFGQWTRFLREWSTTTDCQDQLSWWKSEQNYPAISLPADKLTGENTESFVNEVQVSFDASETDHLLRTAGRDVHALFLAALAATLRDWIGRSRFRLDVEGHGRESLVDSPDVSRTIGWFTSIFPFGIDLTSDQSPNAVFETIRKKLHAVPCHGVGYGVLRYLSRQLEAGPPSSVIFNYLGQFNDHMPGQNSLVLALEKATFSSASANHRPHLLQVTGAVIDGHLQFRLIHSTACHEKETIETHAQKFQAAIRNMLVCLSIPKPDAAAVELDKADLLMIARRYAND